MVIFDRFEKFSTIGNMNEYSTLHVQPVSLQPDYVSTLPGKTKITQKQPTITAVRSVQPIVLDSGRKSFKVFVSFPIC